MSIHTNARRVTSLVGGAFAMTLALAACGGGSDTPEGAAENFLDGGLEDFAGAVAEGDFDRAVEISGEHFCADDVESMQSTADEVAEMSDEELEMMSGAMEEFEIPDDWSYEILESEEDGDTATVEVEMTEDGETRTESLDLVKEDDEWKICGAFV